MNEFEQLCEDLEDRDKEIERLTTKGEQAANYLQECTHKLYNAELEIKRLTEKIEMYRTMTAQQEGEIERLKTQLKEEEEEA